MSTNDLIGAIAGTRTAPALPAVPTVSPHPGAEDATARHPATQQAAPGESAKRPEPSKDLQQVAPAPVLPGTAGALPVAEAALRRALAAGTNQDPHAFALDLLRSVEALIRATAPVGMSPDDIGAAAARLVERQGLLARLHDTQPSGTWPTGVGPEDLTPNAVDTRL
jgi:hypothetical protein